MSYTIPHSTVVSAIDRALEIIDQPNNSLLHTFLEEISIMESGGSPRGLNEITHHTDNPFQMTNMGITDTMRNADGGTHITMRRLHPIVQQNANMSNPWTEQSPSEIKSNVTMNALAAAMLIIRKKIDISSNLSERASQWKQFYNTSSDPHGTPEIYIQKNNLYLSQNESLSHNSTLLLNESKTLPGYLFKPLHQAIIDSQFWTEDNSYEDADYMTILRNNVDQTDAAITLTSHLNHFFKSHKVPTTAAVHSPDPEINSMTEINPGHPNYPNKIIIGGNQGLAGDDSSHRDSSKFLMNLNLGTYGDNFNTDDINPSILAQNIGKLIRHELIHLHQLEDRRKNQRTSRLTTLQRYRDEGEVPATGNREDYISSKIEIDAYAHEFAEELLQLTDRSTALDVLRGIKKASSIPNISDQLKEYLVDNASSSFTRRLKRKMYSHIIDLTARGLY